MNNGEEYNGSHDPLSDEMEERVISWVAGEASESEASELERLANIKPEIGAFRKRVEAMHELAQVAVAVDREPLRLSEERRHELLATFNAVRRRNLALSASFTVLLIAGIAWYGEMTHAVPRIHLIEFTKPQSPFHVDPDPPTPVEAEQTSKVAKPDIGPPQLPDDPVRATVQDFTVPIEAFHPVVDVNMTKIPPGSGTGPDVHPFNPSQLDEQPVAKSTARPIYPESMRRLEISGDATVDFIVDPNGNVRNATAIHSSHREFEDPACSAVSKWKFRPGRKGGRAVFVHMQVPIVFTLGPE
jgi:periplasmic protein TonB